MCPLIPLLLKCLSCGASALFSVVLPYERFQYTNEEPRSELGYTELEQKLGDDLYETKYDKFYFNFHSAHLLRQVFTDG